MLELTSLVVSAVAQACESGVIALGDTLEVTYRHYRYDPPEMWFLEVHIAREASWAERALLISA
jgi:hypothetical protein